MDEKSFHELQAMVERYFAASKNPAGIRRYLETLPEQPRVEFEPYVEPRHIPTEPKISQMVVLPPPVQPESPEPEPAPKPAAAPIHVVAETPPASASPVEDAWTLYEREQREAEERLRQAGR